MLSSLVYLAAFAATVQAHGDHQTVIKEGPHKALWYNTLPGDGGTQVSNALLESGQLALTPTGRLRLLGHKHVRPTALPPLPCQRGCQV